MRNCLEGNNYVSWDVTVFGTGWLTGIECIRVSVTKPQFRRVPPAPPQKIYVGAGARARAERGVRAGEATQRCVLPLVTAASIQCSFLLDTCEKLHEMLSELAAQEA